MNIDLLVYKDGEPLKTVSVTLPVIIGRGKDATFTIKHPLLSREHCEVFEENGAVQVRDLDSLNGTFVDDSRVDSIKADDAKPSHVGKGSQLKLGAVVMKVQYNGASSEDTIAADQATAGEAFDLNAVDTADTEVMAVAAESTEPAAESTEPAPESTEPAPDAAESTNETVVPSENAGAMVDLGDFEVSADAAEATVSSEPVETLDLPDFEMSSPATPPSDSMLDLADFEISVPTGEEGPAAQDLPSLTDLAGAVDEEPADIVAEIPIETAVDTPVSIPEPVADDPWAAPSEPRQVPADDDDDLDAFLKGL